MSTTATYMQQASRHYSDKHEHQRKINLQCQMQFVRYFPWCCFSKSGSESIFKSHKHPNFSITNSSLNNKVCDPTSKKQRMFPSTSPRETKFLHYVFHRGDLLEVRERELRCACILVGKSVCVRVHDGTLRWRVTAVRRDQAYPAHYTENQGRRRVHDDRLPLFTASWPQTYIEHRLTGLGNHRKHITEQSWYIISMRREWERK